MLDLLARHGVQEVVLSSPYLEETFRSFVESRRDDLPVIPWITETEPLGTGGAVVNALDHLDDDDLVFALNGDILTDLDLTAMLEFHRQRGASGHDLAHPRRGCPGVRPCPHRGRRPSPRVPGEARAT